MATTVALATAMAMDMAMAMAIAVAVAMESCSFAFVVGVAFSCQSAKAMMELLNPDRFKRRLCHHWASQT